VPGSRVAATVKIECGVCMQDRLFQFEEFGTAAWPAATIIFICPYGTPIKKVRFAIRRLLKEGYHVAAYQTTAAVFTEANPMILPELIFQLRQDIRSRIAKLASEGVSEYGFFGSSLGSFILYNCIGHEIPELRWGVFNTGGNIAQGLWNMPMLRQLHLERGWSLPLLEDAWADLQWPDFGRLDGCRFVFASSRRDSIAPLRNISQYLEPMLRAGAEVSVHEVPAIGHRTTVIAGLWKGPQLVRMVRDSRTVNRGTPFGLPGQPTARLRAGSGCVPGSRASTAAIPAPGRRGRHRDRCRRRGGRCPGPARLGG
jgi:hypothetical protein